MSDTLTDNERWTFRNSLTPMNSYCFPKASENILGIELNPSPHTYSVIDSNNSSQWHILSISPYSVVMLHMWSPWIFRWAKTNQVLITGKHTAVNYASQLWDPNECDWSGNCCCAESRENAGQTETLCSLPSASVDRRLAIELLRKLKCSLMDTCERDRHMRERPGRLHSR